MDYEIIGNYFFYLQPIGNGSFSTIYKGYRVSDNTPVAIKKITKIIDKKYINSEINVMKNLNSPYILKLYEVIHQKNYLYLILEYCNEGDLSKYIKTKNKKYNLLYIYQIIKGLQYLYKSKIIHRDIKPHNILITNNTIKISDFGFAKTFNENDLISTFCGSPLYMAPEILKLKEYTNKSDIWSLGVIIYEILFKIHPYPSKNKSELIKHLKNKKQIFIPNIDHDLKDLLKKILEKNEYKRISWEEIFDHKWYKDFPKYEKTNYYKLPINNINTNSELDFNILFEDENDNLSHTLDNNSRIRFTSMDNNIVSQSMITINHLNNTKINQYEDSKVYSKSAPHKNYFLENYINQQNQLPGIKNDYKILGRSPTNEYSIMNYLNKSVNTLKNFLNI
jgi:serine/threonine protein kinase